MKVTNLDRKSVQYLIDSLSNDLNLLSKKYGVKLSLGNTRYNDLSLTTKLTAVLDSPQTAGLDPDEVKWARAAKLYSFSYGFKDSAIGKTFKLNGINVKFVGINTRAKAYPYIFKYANGQMFKTGDRSNLALQVKSFKG